MRVGAVGRVGWCLLAVAVVLESTDAQASRVKDIAYLDGVRPNQLIGYGLVVGLDMTGDTQRVGFTQQSLTAMLSRSGVRFDPENLILRNVAAVMVTARLPAFGQPGTRLDVTVGSIGNARSLAGGTLLLTPLNGADGQTYALAQGPLQVGGFSVQGRSGTRVRKNHLNVGVVPSGAVVERSVPIQLAQDGTLTWRLHRPDFTTARLLAGVINDSAGQIGGSPQMARAVDGGSVRVEVGAVPEEALPELISRLETLDVTPDVPARVVLNGRTGTVVMGDQVQLSTVAVAHGGLTLEIREVLTASQPAPAARGRTAVVPETTVGAAETGGQLTVVQGGATLAEVVAALNSLGVKPRDLVQILQGIAAAGALHAELEVL